MVSITPQVKQTRSIEKLRQCELFGSFEATPAGRVSNLRSMSSSAGAPRASGSTPPDQGTWVIDLDGVIWLTGEPIEGVATAVEALRAAGIRTLFATNNSAPTRAELHARMKNCGITTSDEDLLTSADVAAEMLPVGSTALVLADDGVREALLNRGVKILDSGPVDAVVVGWTRGFTFDAISEAASRVREGRD